MADKVKRVPGIRVLYHATTLDQVVSIMETGVNPRYQTPDRRLDFGLGFYTTSQLEQAEDFAYTKQAIRPSSLAAVLEYNLPNDFWPSLNGIEFALRGDATWKKFVMGHRLGTQVAVQERLDYVYGPVADNLRLMKRAGGLPTPIKPPGKGYYDQISFHSGVAAERLNAVMKKGGCQLWVRSNGIWTKRPLPWN